jgi:AraC-like DNA-binding protein
VTLDEIRAAPPGDMYQLSLPTRAGLLHVANTCLEQQDDKHGLDYYAKLAAMSRRAFTRAFADETGVSFSAWRNRARVQMALRLLSDGESVTRVGMQLGYASTSSFITMFRRLVGRSPARYARELIRPPS